MVSVRSTVPDLVADDTTESSDSDSDSDFVPAPSNSYQQDPEERIARERIEQEHIARLTDEHAAIKKKIELELTKAAVERTEGTERKVATSTGETKEGTSGSMFSSVSFLQQNYSKSKETETYRLQTAELNKLADTVTKLIDDAHDKTHQQINEHHDNSNMIADENMKSLMNRLNDMEVDADGMSTDDDMPSLVPCDSTDDDTDDESSLSLSSSSSSSSSSL